MSIPRISVIVPVYNTEKYIGRCIDSILRQTEEDFELLLSDDGSTDSSGVICERYAKIDKRIKVIHNENAGVSSTRNAALDMARGKYIAFVDSDDTIEKDTFAIALQAITHSHTDSVAFGYKKLASDGSFLYDSAPPSATYYFGDDKEKRDFWIKKILMHKVGWEVCFQLLSGDIIRRNNIRFLPDVHWGEDLCFTSVYTLYSDGITCLTNKFYNYYKYDNSATGGRVGKVLLDEVNTASYLLKDDLVKRFGDVDDIYPLAHYLIMSVPFKRLTQKDFSSVKDYVRAFEYVDFHKQNINALMENMGEYIKYVDKKEAYIFRRGAEFFSDYKVGKYRWSLFKDKLVKKIRG